MRQIGTCSVAAAVGFFMSTGVYGALYRIVPSSADVLAGASTSLQVEAATLAGDNLAGVGHFSFAIDLLLGGTAGATGSNISNVLINQADFDDLGSHHLGNAQGNQYLDVAAATTDVFAPNFGRNVGDVTPLFTFDLLAPPGAAIGTTIIITPSEGFLRNLTVSPNFDPVSPQTFAGATLVVVPEPATLLLALIAAIALWRRR
ncbi:MAG TPA: PEP-CTERM sorting domain-containing protein [Phycisphaerae bacterium]|nr:PEP-CTERM sorting domain-containing protein [Phycisphaerae bacterium]HNU44805.1 PEP-CTERM sorting domain-containing protein [Phycisphaerae bacterium]